MKMRLHGCKVAVAGNKIENKGDYSYAASAWIHPCSASTTFFSAISRSPNSSVRS